MPVTKAPLTGAILPKNVFLNKSVFLCSIPSKVVWSSYMTSAALSYFAPPGMKYSKKLSSMKIHRLLSWVHFAGMASIPFLGYNIHNSGDYDKAVTLHQNVAYVTLFSMSLSALLTFLPY